MPSTDRSDAWARRPPRPSRLSAGPGAHVQPALAVPASGPVRRVLDVEPTDQRISIKPAEGLGLAPGLMPSRILAHVPRRQPELLLGRQGQGLDLADLGPE